MADRGRGPRQFLISLLIPRYANLNLIAVISNSLPSTNNELAGSSCPFTGPSGAPRGYALSFRPASPRNQRGTGEPGHHRSQADSRGRSLRSSASRPRIPPAQLAEQAVQKSVRMVEHAREVRPCPPVQTKLCADEAARTNYNEPVRLTGEERRTSYLNVEN
jgi:hypothetical protein